MLAIELINDYVVPIKPSDKALTTLSLMEEYKVKHLPIVSEEQFLGLISEEDIFQFHQYEEAVGAHPIAKPQIYVTENKHIYDVLTAFQLDKLTLLPVIDEKNRYRGSILASSLVSTLAEITGVTNPGGIIVLEMNILNYSLSQIAQIIESNNAKIINLYVRTFHDSTQMEITLKINTINIDAILQTFNRYNYQVYAAFSTNRNDEKLRENYDSLMNYLKF